jgi:hypothetical protein
MVECKKAKNNVTVVGVSDSERGAMSLVERLVVLVLLGDLPLPRCRESRRQSSQCVRCSRGTVILLSSSLLLSFVISDTDLFFDFVRFAEHADAARGFGR